MFYQTVLRRVLESLKPAEKLDGICAYQVDQFVEKPNSTLAKEYVDSGYYWNSGMFMFKASVFLENLGMYATDIFDLCETIESSSVSDHGFLHLSEDLFRKCQVNLLIMLLWRRHKIRWSCL